MLGVYSVAEECYFTEEAKSHNDTGCHYYFNEHFCDDFCHGFFVNFIVNFEEHFLLEVCFSGRLFVDEFLRNFCLLLSRYGPVEIVFECLRNGFHPDYYSPKWLRHVFFYLNVRAREGKASPLLDFYFRRAEDRWLIVGAAIVLVGCQENERFQVIRVA